jgi:hypothetical protein
MKHKCKLSISIKVFLSIIVFSVISVSSAYADEHSKYLNTVRSFADRILQSGKDTYGPKTTPLFVDGLNVTTLEPVK